MEYILLTLLFFIWHSLGITLAYHRVLTHKAAKCNKALLYFLLFGGYLALQGPPVAWAAVHRYHHQYTDTPKDPHTPNKGFWYSFNGWIWFPKNEDIVCRRHLVSDLLKDPVLCWFGTDSLLDGSALSVSINLAWRAVLWLLFGPTVALISLAVGVFVFLLPQLINTLCHTPKLGYRNYQTEDLSTNVWWLSLPTLGESWHNNHHYKPSRLSQGEPHEFDLTYQIAKVFRFLKLMDFK